MGRRLDLGTRPHAVHDHLIAALPRRPSPAPRWRLVSAAAIVSLFADDGPESAVVDWPIRGIALVTDGPGSGSWPARGRGRPAECGSRILAAAAAPRWHRSVLRWRRASGIERAQLQVARSCRHDRDPRRVRGLETPISDPRLGAIIAFCAIPLIPAAIGIAILRYRLYDIDRIISRTVSLCHRHADAWRWCSSGSSSA